MRRRSDDLCDRIDRTADKVTGNTDTALKATHARIDRLSRMFASDHAEVVDATSSPLKRVN